MLCSLAPTRGAGLSARTRNTLPAVSTLETTPPRDKGAREGRVREIDRDRLAEHSAHPRGCHRLTVSAVAVPSRPRRLGNGASRAIMLGGAVGRRTRAPGGDG